MQCEDVQRILILFTFEGILVAYFRLVHGVSADLVVSPGTIRGLYIVGTLCILLAYVGALWWHEVHKERLLEGLSRALNRLHYRIRRCAGVVRWLSACRKARVDHMPFQDAPTLPLDDWLLLEHVATLKPRHERERLRLQATHTAALATLSSLPGDLRKLVWQQGGFNGHRLRYLGDQIAGLEGWRSDVLRRLQGGAPSGAMQLHEHALQHVHVVPCELYM